MDDLTLSPIPEGRRCPRCGEIKPLDAFGRDTRCRGCNRWRKRERQFGLDRAAFDAKLSAQGGECAVCHRHNPPKRSKRYSDWCVDHDHRTGKVRGIVCYRCNVALGYIEHDDTMAQMGDYLRRHSVD